MVARADSNSCCHSSSIAKIEEDGTYVKELFINFKKEANMKYVLWTGTSFRVAFEGPDIEGQGHVADLEILAYDLQP